jgi:hypothetical protein
VANYSTVAEPFRAQELAKQGCTRGVANALMQVDPANEFLSLVNCLETFLTLEGDAESISKAISVGVAWDLGQNFAQRQSFRKEMKKLYDKKSSITHRGQQDDLADGLLL